MTNCTSYTLSGLNATCKNSIGGISEVYIANYEDLWKTKIDDNGMIIPYIHRGTSFYEFKLRKGQASFTGTLNVNENGANYYTNAITMNFSKMDTAKRNEMMALVGNDVIVIFKDNNGKCWFLGKDEPVQVTEASGTTGNVKSDANMYTITIAEESKELPFEVPVNIYEGIGVDWTQEYLTLETNQNGTNIFLEAYNGNPDEENPIILQVSMDKNTWHNVRVADEEINQFATAFGLQFFKAGTKIYVRGWNSGFTYDDIVVSLVCDKPTYVYGNILSTLDGDNFRTIHYLPLDDSIDPEEAWGEFGGFFNYFDFKQRVNKILSHPTKELTIPIESTFSMGTFNNMFQGCTLIEQAPYIVVDEIGVRPVNSNTVFGYMFDGCSNLSYIRTYTQLPESETTNWVRNVSTNGTFVTDLPDRYTRGVNGIPTNWQVIKK